VEDERNLNHDTYTFSGTTNLTYYAAQADGTYAESANGEFIKARTKGSGAHDVYVHYTQVFQPNEDTRNGFDIMTMVYGVMYQNANYQLARMSNLLDQAERLNENMRVLVGLYQNFMAIQANVPTGARSATVLDYTALQAFMDAGIDLPQSQVMVGLVPVMYYSAWSNGVTETVWDEAKYQIFRLSSEASSGEHDNYIGSGKTYVYSHEE
jgi:hypothetical protein